MGTRLIRGLVSPCVGGTLLVACGAGPSLHAGGVRVTARLVQRDGVTSVETTFIPDESGFHIYSAELPDGGIDGLGIPTTVEPGDGFASLGPVVPSKPEVQLRIDALDVDLPVYPDGEVRLTQLASTTSVSGRRTVVVSYGACSRKVCLAPVRDRAVPVRSGG
jgi:hypothetical protein